MIENTIGHWFEETISYTERIGKTKDYARLQIEHLCSGEVVTLSQYSAVYTVVKKMHEEENQIRFMFYHVLIISTCLNWG